MRLFNSLTRFLFALTLSSLAIVPFLAQESEGDPVCTANFSQMIVEQQISEARSIENRKRVRVTLRAADFLWDLDQESARRHFSDSFTVALNHFREKGHESSTLGSGSSQIPTQQSDLRTDVIRAVAKRDAEMATKMADKLLEELEELKDKRNGRDSERETIDLLAIAAEYADTSPGLSLYLFRRAMTKPVNHGWYFYLFQAAGKNRTLADQVYSEAVRNYSRELPSRMLFLSAYPFARDRIMGPDQMSFGTNIPSEFAPDLLLQRQFIQTFFARVIAISEDPTQIPERPDTGFPPPEPLYISVALIDLEQQIAANHPELLQQFVEVRARADSLLTGGTRDRLGRRKDQQSAANKTFEERIKLAEEADSEGKLNDGDIISLVTFSTITEPQFKLLEPFLAKVKDEQLRKELSSHFWFRRSERAISDKRYDDAERYSDRVPELDHRAVLKLRLVDELAAAGSAAERFEMLNTLSKLVRSSPNSVAKVQILLALVSQYDTVNKSIALDELSEAIRVMNQLGDVNLTSTSVLRMLRSSTMSHYAIVNLPGANIENVFTGLSKQGVEIPLANARRIDDRFYRLLAVLAIAKNCSNKVKAETKKAQP